MDTRLELLTYLISKRDGSAGKGACSASLVNGVGFSEPHKGGTREPTPYNCPLTSNPGHPTALTNIQIKLLRIDVL